MRLRVLRAPHFIGASPQDRNHGRTQSNQCKALDRFSGLGFVCEAVRLGIRKCRTSCARLLVESGTLGLAENAQILKVGSTDGSVASEAHGESDGMAGIAHTPFKRSCVVSVRPAHLTRCGVMVRVNGQVAEDADGNGAHCGPPRSLRRL